MITENFDSGFSVNGKSWSEETAAEYDESSQTSQFRCLKRNREPENIGKIDKINVKSRFYFNSDKKEKEEKFGKFSIIWIILPVINLIIDIIYDFCSLIMFFIKKIFDMTYNMIVPSAASLIGEESGIRIGNKYCVTYTWFRYLVLILCPPAGVFMAYGLRGWFQILICCLASLFYYFPGLAYALIVINRSEVASFVKATKDPNSCNDDGSLLNGLFISDADNKKKCTKKPGEPCSKKIEDCCANPELINGQWMRGVDGENKPIPALDRHSNPITSFAQGEVVCRNDTKKIKSKKGICVWKESMKPN
jgi:uncharacterized membrane protein YqaE (UPF0057 family)